MNRLYQVAFILAVASVATGIGLGVYQSFAAGEGLPPVYINYTDEIQRLLVDGDDYERAALALGFRLVTCVRISPN